MSKQMKFVAMALVMSLGLAAAVKAAVEVGKQAPTFSLKDQNDNTITLESLRGKWVVLYFYPKDDTPGCTIEAKECTASINDFKDLQAVVYGCSADSTESHRAFIKKYDLKVNLLSDPTKETMKAYGAISPDGKKVVRSTVIIDPAGHIAAHWPTVKPQGHAAELKAKLTELQKKS
jgi:peroxiredoxin Q/BCP